VRVDPPSPKARSVKGKEKAVDVDEEMLVDVEGDGYTSSEGRLGKGRVGIGHGHAHLAAKHVSCESFFPFTPGID